MLAIKHLDGADVIVTDSRGRHVPAVDEVRIEPGLAVLAVHTGAHAWLQDIVSRAPEQPISCAIRSRDGQLLHHCGEVRVVCA
jgi:hypothetical protein